MEYCHTISYTNHVQELKNSNCHKMTVSSKNVYVFHRQITELHNRLISSFTFRIGSFVVLFTVLLQ